MFRQEREADRPDAVELPCSLNGEQEDLARSDSA